MVDVAVAAVVVVTCLGAIAEVVRLCRRRTATRAAAREARVRLAALSMPHWVSYALLGGAVVLGAMTWIATMKGLAFPPGWDAMHHGYFTRQILDHQTLDGSVVLAPSASGETAPDSFYPLLFNLCIAVIEQVSGTAVSQVMFAGIATTGAVFLPVTVYALARRIDPGRPLVAGLAAFIAPLSLSTYALIGTGRDNTVLGLALTLGTALALLAARTRAGVAVGALGVVGIIGIHTSEMPVALIMAASIAVVDVVRSRRLDVFRCRIVVVAASVVAAIVCLVVLEPTILSASSSREGAIGTAGPGIDLRDAVSQMLTLGWDRNAHSLPVLQILLGIGLLATLLLPGFRAYLSTTLAYGLIAALMVGLFTQSLGPLQVVASPWYGDLNRLAWTFPVLTAIPAAVAVVAVAECVGRLAGAIGRHRRHRAVRRDYSRTGLAVVTVAAACGLILTALPDTARTNLELHVLFGPADADSRAAFEYLQEDIRPGEVVMDDRRASGSLWMYDDYGVPPLFGNSPYLGAAPKSWKERLWLIRHLDDVADDPCVDALLAKYRVGYVYYDDARILEGERRIEKAVLDRHRQFTPVFDQNGVTVYRVARSVDVPRCDRDVTRGITW
ncbi:hypothetical protein DX116_04360 [Aeromicrobium endophyticum]|uniref:Glycosyltransferase RgtA/B/C/D-like domain-containing protein n=1 Tax=Aeromicrobium endophyticum TaxID=2292704 RepID=A0A371PBC0_9ACTN|nr:hypothetical protein DX116_04360 [Aeromicrobium endophyticum]